MTTLEKFNQMLESVSQNNDDKIKAQLELSGNKEQIHADLKARIEKSKQSLDHLKLVLCEYEKKIKDASAWQKLMEKFGKGDLPKWKAKVNELQEQIDDCNFEIKSAEERLQKFFS